MAADVTTNQGQASGKTHASIDRAAERVEQKTRQTAREAKEKVDAAVDRAEARVQQATDAGAQGAHHAADKAEDWRQRGGAATDDLRDQVGNLFDHARLFVREKPMESVAIALAAGWLIGRLLSPRR